MGLCDSLKCLAFAFLVGYEPARGRARVNAWVNNSHDGLQDVTVRDHAYGQSCPDISSAPMISMTSSAGPSKYGSRWAVGEKAPDSRSC